MVLVQDLTACIEHTLLKQEADETVIGKLCEEAIANAFFGVCVNSCWVSFTSHLLKQTKVKVISTAGFPLGTASTRSKCSETEQAFTDGAQEVDFVMNVGWLKSGQPHKVLNEFKQLVKVASLSPLKVILETSLLTQDEIKLGCKLALEAGIAFVGIAFVKTSTGFNSMGANASDVQLMSSIVSPHAGVKASGGIRSLSSALAMLDAGAERLGTSNGLTILAELKKVDNLSRKL